MSVDAAFETGCAQSDPGADARHHSSDWTSSELEPGSDVVSCSCGTGGRSIWSPSSLFEGSICAFSTLGLPGCCRRYSSVAVSKSHIKALSRSQCSQREL